MYRAPSADFHVLMPVSYTHLDAMFMTQGSSSFTAHQDLIRGGTEIDSSHSLIDDPAAGGSGVWGCDSPPRTKTSLITTNLKLEKYVGPFPCTSDFPSSGSHYTTPVSYTHLDVYKRQE